MLKRLRTALICVCMIGCAPRAVSTPSPVRAVASGWVLLDNGLHAAVVRFEMEPGWHMYWENPGDSGAPPSAFLSSEESWTLLEPIFPRPSILKSDNSVEFGYDNSWEWILPIAESAVADSVAGRKPPGCSFDISWMVCKLNCQIGSARVDLPPAEGEIPPVGSSRMGRSLPSSGATAEFNPTDGTISIVCKAAHSSSTVQGASGFQCIPGTMPGIELPGPGPFPATLEHGEMSLRLPLEIQPSNTLGKPLRFEGLILFGDSNGDRCESIRLPLAPGASNP